MMPNKLIVANLKMDMALNDVINYLNIISDKINNKKVIICPTSIFIPYFLFHNYQVGIQNVFYESQGAYTGEVSPKQASSIGVNYALIGHKERRQIFKEDDLIVNKKIKACLKHHLKVILCVGESKKDIDKIDTNIILKKQLICALEGVPADEFKNIIIAYEPSWAIGTSITPSNEQIRNIVDYIKDIIKVNFNYQDSKVLYGGSINDINITEINKIENVDGYLIGEASIDSKKFLSIIEVIQKG